MKTPAIFILVAGLAISPTFAQKYKTEIPPQITTPDTLETRLGTLKFNDGFPDDAGARGPELSPAPTNLADISLSHSALKEETP